jgi:hypothetical protein
MSLSISTTIASSENAAGPTAPELPAGGPLLKPGSAFNARVSVVATPTGPRVMKDFSFTPFLVRHTLGRFLIWREWATLCRLQGLPGVPADPVRVHAFALSYHFVAGETLSAVHERHDLVDRDLFVALEKLVVSLHDRGFAHLDLRNGKNILRTTAGQPSLLDFQAGLWLGWAPKAFRRHCESVDLSGVYKWWHRMAPGHMDARRLELLQTMNRRRLLWRFNYPAHDGRLRH